MSITVEEVVVKLRAELADYDRRITTSTKVTEQGFDRIGNASDRAESRVRANTAAIERQLRSSSASIEATLRRTAGTFAAYFSGRELVGFVDGYTRVQNALKVAGLEGDRLASVQSRLLDLSTRYGVSLEALSGLFGNASQAGKELGASQSQILSLTEATSQALLITGTSTQAASGAILGLSQALASGTVRAEEYNQINEGGLRPLLQAAANAERFGGSINNLRAAVLDGKVSSQEFFRAILDGAASLEGQAAKATQTLAGAMEALRSQLTFYVGEASAANGVTVALSKGILGLANNLDSVVNVLAVIAAVGFGRFAAGALSGGRALQVVSAYASVATTSLAGTALAARAAGTALVTSLGGPVAVAITALTLGVGFLVSKSYEAEAAADALKASIDGQSASLGTLIERNARAAAETGNLSARQRQAITATASLTGEVDLLATAWGRVAAQAKSAAIEQARAAQLKASQNVIAAGEAYNRAKNAQGPAPFGSTDPMDRRLGIQTGRRAQTEEQQAATVEARRLFAQAIANRRILKAETARIENQPLAQFRAPESAVVAKPDKKGPKGPRGKSEEQRREEAERVEAEIRNAQLAYLQELAASTLNAQERAQLEIDAIEVARKAQEIEIKQDERLSDAQRRELLAINDNIAGLRKSQITRQEEERLREQALAITTQALRDEDAMLQLKGQLATTADEQRKIDKQRLALSYAILRSEAAAELAAAQHAKDAARIAAAEAQIARLKEREAAEGAVVDRANANPIERLRDSLSDPKTQVQEAVVQELQSVRDGITDGIADFIGTDDPFLKSLIKILIEQVLIKPITEALSNIPGGGGIGGLFGGIISGIGSLFGGGRAAGGPVAPGTTYLVGEKGPELLRMGAQPGVIIPNNRLMAAPQAQGMNGTLRIELSPDLEARMIKTSGTIAVEVSRALQPETINKSVAETTRQLRRPRP